MRALLFSIAIVWSTLAAYAPTVRAQAADSARDAEGRGLFEAGRAAFADGRYEDALDYYDRAYELSHRPQLLYNIGSAYDRLRRDRDALAAFEEYLRELPEADNAREVEARLRVLREAIAHDDASAHPIIATHVEPTPPPTEPTPLPTTAVEPTTTVTTTVTTPTTTPTTTTIPTPTPAANEDHGPGVLGEWWLWTIVGVVAAGGVALGVVLATQGGGTTTYPPYQTGDNGAVVLSLTGTMP